jgi:hypothetical protein
MNPSDPRFVTLFNRGVDSVRYLPEKGILIEMPDAENPRATHRLVCTAWNGGISTDNLVKRRRHKLTRPKGFALSVCAEPLRRHEAPSPHKLVLPLMDTPCYSVKGSIRGKRAVLCAMVQSHATPRKMEKLIGTLPNEKLDALYRSLLRADRRLRRKLKHK